MVEDFEEVDDFDDLGVAGYADDYADYEHGYDDYGPARPARSTPNRKKTKRRKASDDDEGFGGTVIGGILSVLGGIVLCVLGVFNLEHRGGVKALIFGGFLIVSGVGALVKGMMD